VESGTHEFESHTSEVQVRVQAATLRALYEEAGLALADIMLGEGHAEAPPDADEERVTVEAGDPEALLVDWLNELIFRADARKKVYTDINVERLSGGELRARVKGFTPEVLKTAVKAATFHGLEIRQHEDGFAATAVLDV
jgi:SHS2 domain-containing protein